MANKQFADANNIKELWIKIRQTFLRQSDASSTYATKEENAAKANLTDLANVATSGSYNDLSDVPEIPGLEDYATIDYVDNEISDLKNDTDINLQTTKTIDYMQTVMADGQNPTQQYVTETITEDFSTLKGIQDAVALEASNTMKIINLNDYFDFDESTTWEDEGYILSNGESPIDIEVYENIIYNFINQHKMVVLKLDNTFWTVNFIGDYIQCSKISNSLTNIIQDFLIFEQYEYFEEEEEKIKIKLFKISINYNNYITLTDLNNYATLTDLEEYATIDSPIFTGTPKSVTPSVNDNSTKIATTAFVMNAINNIK